MGVVLGAVSVGRLRPKSELQADTIGAKRF